MLSDCLQDAFTAELWVAIVLTTLAVGCIMWAVERWARIGTDPPAGDTSLTIQEQVWISIGRPMQASSAARALSGPREGRGVVAL